MNPLTLKWEQKIRKALEGRTIKEVRYLNDKEMKGMSWHSKSVVIFLDNGTYLFASADDEGNGPGALFTNIKDLETIPVCS